MNLRPWGLVALGLASAMLGAAPAAAQAVQVERSGNTYHVAACPRGNPLGTARCFAHVVTDARGNPMNGKLSPNAGSPSGYGPSDLRSAYNITTNGTTTIAIVDADGYSNAESDLATYRAQYGLPACTTANGCFRKVNQSGVQGNYPRDDTGWSQESALDLDMASAMCPGCKLVLVEASSNSFANLAAAVNTAASIAGVTVISNSYGGGESGSQSYESAYNHPGKAVTGGIYGVTGSTPTGAASIYANAGQLNDVTSGTNGSCGGTYFCTAGTGYDGPTGNGTPNGTGPF